jgi:hypothetical protein
MELGIYSFVDRTPDPATGETVSPQQRRSDLLGEHHRPDYVSSAPTVILGAAAALPSGSASRPRSPC